MNNKWYRNTSMGKSVASWSSTFVKYSEVQHKEWQQKRSFRMYVITVNYIPFLFALGVK